MNKLIHSTAVFILFSFGMISSLYSSDTLKVAKSKLLFDNIALNNPWINSSNPAGIALSGNFSQGNLLETGYSYQHKDIHFPGEPGITNAFCTRAKGYRNIGKLSTFGSFAYINDHYDNLLYNNTLIFDPDNPYLLGDTAGGMQRKEGFQLKGSLAFPITGKIIFGIDADYQNYVGAKNNDPRNKNDISSLEITPGIIYSSGKISAGLSGGPIIFNDEISIQVMEDNYDMYQFLGYGYYKLLKNVVNYENAYFGKGFNSEAQFSFQNDYYSNLTLIGFKSYTEEVRYGGTFRLTDGISERTTFTFSNYQRVRRDTKIIQMNLIFNAFSVNGIQLMEHFETIMEGAYSYDSLVTDHRIDGKHIINQYKGGIEYALTKEKSPGKELYRYSMKLSSEYNKTAHYPIQTNGLQEVLNFMITVGYRRPF